MSEQLDPEDVQAIMGRIKAEAVRIVEGHGGIVNQFVGDEVLALFGIPTAHKDDPVRAVRAAGELHEMVRGMSTEVEPRLGRALRLHSGINTGLIVTSMGDDRDGRVGVTGDTVNTGARLRALAQDDMILLGPGTRSLVADVFETEALEPVALKGKAGTITPYRLLAERATPAKAPQPFIGRRAELRQFAGIVAMCLESGRGQAVYVRGDAGIGKTWLVDEFRAIASGRGFACHMGLVLDFGMAKSHDAIRTIVSSLLKIPPGASDDDRREAAGRAHADGLVEEARAPFLNDLLDLPQPGDLRPIYDAMDNETRNRGKRETVCGLLRRCGTEQPVMVTIEDLHWADSITLAHLAALAKAAADSPALLVMTSRLEGDPVDQAWRGASGGSPLTTIDLAALRPEEARELAGQFLDIATDFAERCVERAAGNPLFLVQLMRAAEESTEDIVPGSVQSLVLARMDHLDPADRVALQAASIFGQRFPLDALRAMTGNADYRCDGLVAHYLVRPEGEGFLFAHALVQEGVYGSLLKARRRELHRRAAEWFAGRDLPLRAEHLDRAEHPAAAQAYLDAARGQAAEFRHETALRFAQQGTELAGEPALRFTLSCYMGELLHDLGRNAEAIEAYREAERLAEDDVQRCRAWIGQAKGMRVIDQHQDALAMLEKAQKPATDHHMTLELAQIHHLRGNLYFPLGNMDGCLKEHEAALKWAREAGSQEAEARSLGGLGDAYYLNGRMRTAYESFRRCVDLCHQHGIGQVEVANLPMVGWSGIYTNELHRVLNDGLAAAEMAEKVRHQRAESQARGLIGFVKIDMGEFVDAEDQLNKALACARDLKARRFESHYLCDLGKIAEAQGKHADALKLVEQALEICRETGMNYIGPAILAFLALITDDSDTRQRALDEGENLLRQGCVSHNYFWFYRDAMEVCLNTRDWDAMERYAAALEEYTRPEPLPWSDFFIARGRALSAFGQGQRAEELVAELRDLRSQAQRTGLKLAQRALEDALETI